MSAATIPLSLRSLTPGQAILWGGLLCGALDATDGVVAYGLHAGLNPIQVLQFIASGVLGSSAFQGGLPAAGVIGHGLFVGLPIAFYARRVA